MSPVPDEGILLSVDEAYPAVNLVGIDNVSDNNKDDNDSKGDGNDDDKEESGQRRQGRKIKHVSTLQLKYRCEYQNNPVI
jgi:hypothetical protein